MLTPQLANCSRAFLRADAFAADAEGCWEIKRQVTPQYLKVQDPDCFRVGTERIPQYADKKSCALSFGIGTLLLRKGTSEDIIRDWRICRKRDVNHL
jgi:hypothetical protein